MFTLALAMTLFFGPACEMEYTLGLDPTWFLLDDNAITEVFPGETLGEAGRD